MTKNKVMVTVTVTVAIDVHTNPNYCQELFIGYFPAYMPAMMLRMLDGEKTTTFEVDRPWHCKKSARCESSKSQKVRTLRLHTRIKEVRTL